MKLYKLIVFGLLIALCFSTAVSAVEISNADIMNQPMSISEYGEFDDIKSQIESATSGQTVYLDNKYYNVTSKVEINANITINGATNTSTEGFSVLDGLNTNQIFEIKTGCNVKFLNIKFINAFNNVSNGAVIIAENETNLEISNCDFENNSAITNISDNGFGGAIYVGNRAQINISYCNFTNNRATNGGTIYLNFNSEAIIRICIFKDNNATNGGALVFAQNANLTIKNCNFTNNNATDDGGAIFGNEKSIIKIVESNFENNKANTGGAVKVLSETDIEIENATFIKNSADDFGGAIAIYLNAVGQLKNVLFDNNSAQERGGALRINDGSLVEICNCTFINNNAVEYGGAIYAWAGLTVKNSTFNNNSADIYGSAIYNDGALVLVNSNFNEEDSNGYATVYLQKDGEETVSLNNNTISSNLLPIYNNGSMIVSPTKVVVIDNDTYNKVLGDEITLWAYLYDDNDNAIGGSSPLYITVGPARSSVPAFFNQSGNWSYVTNYTVDKAGELPVTAASPDANATEVIPGLLIVPFESCNVSIAVDDQYYQNTINGTVTLTNANGTGISGIVNVAIGYWNKNVTVENGIGSFIVDKDVVVSNGTGSFVIDRVLDVGNYTANVTFDGNGAYIPTSNTTTFEIFKVNTTASISIEDTTYGNPIIVVVHVKDMNGHEVTGEATVVINGKEYAVNVINGEGILLIPDKLEPGNYSASVFFNNDLNHYSSFNVTNFTIEEAIIPEPDNNSTNESIVGNKVVSGLETGNPILLLLVVLMALPLRRFLRR